MNLKYIIAMAAGITLATVMVEAKGGGDRVRDCDRDPVKTCTQECTRACDKDCTQDCEKKQDGSGAKGQKRSGGGSCKK